MPEQCLGDFSSEAQRFLQRSAGGRLVVQHKYPFVEFRQESTAELEKDPRRAGENQGNHDKNDGGVVQRPAEGCLIPPRAPAQDAALAGLLFAVLPVHVEAVANVKIAGDDISLPLPPMRTPDVRQLVLEVLLELLADSGVDDVHVVIAIALHRRMTAAEVRRMVGDRIFEAWWPDRLYHHDAEDPQGLVSLGATEQGEKVIVNRRAAESDLLVYVNLNLVPMDAGHT